MIKLSWRLNSFISLPELAAENFHSLLARPLAPAHAAGAAGPAHMHIVWS